jgi:hypothetical protein
LGSGNILLPEQITALAIKYDSRAVGRIECVTYLFVYPASGRTVFILATYHVAL